MLGYSPVGMPSHFLVHLPPINNKPKLDVVAHICGVTDPAHLSHPTYSQALAEYCKQFDEGHVKIVLVPGSEWAQKAKEEMQAITFKDEYGEFTYDQEVADAVYEAEVYAEAEKAYRTVLELHGFPIPK